MVESVFNFCTQKEYDDYMKLSLWEESLTMDFEWENVFSDEKEDNAPYDLLIDVENMSEILFKSKLEKIDFWNINMKQSWMWWWWWGWGSSNWSDNILQDFNLNLPINNWYTNSIFSSGNSLSWDDSVSSETGDGLEEEWSWWNLSWEGEQMPLYSNPDLQLWNTCWCKQSSWDNSESWQNIDSQDLIWLSDDSILSQKYWFDVFSWNNWQLWTFISISWFNDLFNTWWDSEDKSDSDLAKDLSSWKKVCWSDTDKILSICLQLIPSWPRWSVWWTTFVKSIEDIIIKIDDSLKDIKQSFIIPAWHGDEALDIDFKHVKFADIFAFDIILEKKPIFRQEKNNSTNEKDRNKPDTKCEWVPRKLSKIYASTHVANCFSSEIDKNKYLFSNVGAVQYVKKDLSGFEKDIYKDSADWQAKVWSHYWELLTLIEKFVDNLNTLIWEWNQTASSLKAKAQ